MKIKRARVYPPEQKEICFSTANEDLCNENLCSIRIGQDIVLLNNGLLVVYVCGMEQRFINMPFVYEEEKEGEKCRNQTQKAPEDQSKSL